MLCVASIEIFVLSVASIKSCLVCGEYRNLVLYGDYRNLLSVMSIESCVVCDEYRNLVSCVTSIEILCCLATIESCL